LIEDSGEGIAGEANDHCSEMARPMMETQARTKAPMGAIEAFLAKRRAMEFETWSGTSQKARTRSGPAIINAG